MTEGWLAHLYAMRAHIDALIVVAQTELGMVPPQEESGTCPECKASPDFIKDVSTMDGIRRSHCNNCGNEWER